MLTCGYSLYSRRVTPFSIFGITPSDEAEIERLAEERKEARRLGLIVIYRRGGSWIELKENKRD